MKKDNDLDSGKMEISWREDDKKVDKNGDKRFEGKDVQRIHTMYKRQQNTIKTSDGVSLVNQVIEVVAVDLGNWMGKISWY